jgi:hypothetical protein
VYDTSDRAWRRFAAGTLAAARLNQPSIAVAELVGAGRAIRTVTNVSNRAETYVADVSGLRGLSVSVTPGQVRLAPGESARFIVRLSANRTARYGVFAHGELTWVGSRGHLVRSPIVVRPEFLDAPDEVVASHARTGARLEARAGVTGTLRVRASGLVSAAPVPFTLEPGAFDPTSPNLDSSSMVRWFTVQRATRVARFTIDAASDADDLDLYVYRDSNLVASAVTAAGGETVTLTRPRPGVYSVFVNSASSPVDGTTSGTFTGWVLPRNPERTVQVTPDPVTVTGGLPFEVRASWSGLDPDRAWFGYLTYRGADMRTYLTIR